MAQFVEKYNGGSNRRSIFRQMDRANIVDIPMQQHVLKSESMDLQEADELNENVNMLDTSIITEGGDLIILEHTISDNLRIE